MFLTETSLWTSNDQDNWKDVENAYWDSKTVKRCESLYRELDAVDSNVIKNYTAEEFYNFLHDKYYVWKFTDKRILPNCQHYLSRHKDDFSDFSKRQKAIFNFDLNDINAGIKCFTDSKTRIGGMAVSAGSGLLSLLFPEYFGTVDLFVVLFLQKVDGISDRVMQIKEPRNLKPAEAALLIQLMRDKANKLNEANATTYWTPRRIDKCLWSFREYQKKF